MKIFTEKRLQYLFHLRFKKKSFFCQEDKIFCFFIKNRVIKSEQEYIQMIKKLSLTKKCFIGAFCFFYVFFLLYFIIRPLGDSHPWSSFVYFYGLGGMVYIVFSSALIRLRAIRLSHRSDRRWFYFVSVGLVCVCLLHMIWILFSIYSPYKGL